jgi:hypothetical protein
VSIFVDKEAMHCPKIKCESCSFVNEKLSNFEKMCDDVKTDKPVNNEAFVKAQNEVHLFV